MKPYLANKIIAIVLLSIGGWGFFSSASIMDLVPVAFGLVFLLANIPFKRGNQVVANIIAVLTFVLLLALVQLLTRAINSQNVMAFCRVIIIMTACLFGLFIYARNYFSTKKN